MFEIYLIYLVGKRHSGKRLVIREPLKAEHIVIKYAVKANILHAQLIVNELYMITNILSVQLEGMIVADSELPGKISRNGFCIFIYYDFHMHLTRTFTICLTLC